MFLRTLLVSGTVTAALAQQPVPLTALNDAFRAAYAESRTRVLAGARPILIVNGDNFSLLRGPNQRLEASTATPVYDPVKTMAHIPLAIYVALTPGEGPLADRARKTLEKLRDLIPPAETSLASIPLSPESRDRQHQIAAAGLSYIVKVLADGQYTRATLTGYTRAMTPLVMRNVAEATRAQLDATHSVVSRWRKDLTPEEWGRLKVVIIGPHMPREDLVVTQYFLRLLGEPQEGDRVIYAESLWQENQALDSLGTHLLDGGVGSAFFGEYMRMHRDLLGDAAREYLRQILP